MASSTLLAIALALTISLQGSIGNKIECEDLNEDSCAYAVSSTGKRCVLEKPILRSGYICRTSEIVADELSSLIETEECITSCSLGRKDLGISSDSLLERGFVDRLCSDSCYLNCPNIVDLFFNLAAGEGVYLPQVCEAQKSNGRREMLEVNSGGDPHAPGPAQTDHFGVGAATTLDQLDGVAASPL